MRVWHLLDLVDACGASIRALMDDDPLVLPAALSRDDREVLLAFFQRVVASEPVERLEVDWHHSLLQADRTFLERMHRRAGAGKHLLVVRVHEPDVDLHEILDAREVRAFRHVAVVGIRTLGHERWGTLSKLAKEVAACAEDLYREWTPLLGLRAEGWRLVMPLVAELLNPVDVLETYNHLVAVQLEPRAEPAARVQEHDLDRSAGVRDAVYRRMLARLLERLDTDVLVGLAGVVIRKPPSKLPKAIRERWPAIEQSLRDAMLVRDGRPVRWARFLDGALQEVLLDALTQRANPPRNYAKAAGTAVAWIDRAGLAKKSDDNLRVRIVGAMRQISERRLEQAADELDAVAADPGLARATDVAKGFYWDAMGRLLYKRGKWDEAEVAFRRSLALAEEGGDTPTSLGMTMSELARGLRDNGRADEAALLLREREALLVEVEGSDASGQKKPRD